ncbi:MAG: DUF4870 domain-containing protein [Sumerlaeia bacterium]
MKSSALLKSETVVRPEERGFAATAHLITMIPLWGYLFLILLYLHFREKSREVVFHIQQAMAFMFVSLCVFLFYLFASLIIKLIKTLDANVAIILDKINLGFLIAVYSVYCIICIYAIISVYMGKPFIYPLVGKKLLRGFKRSIE